MGSIELREDVKRSWSIRGPRHLVVVEGFLREGGGTGWTVGIYVYPAHPKWDAALETARFGSRVSTAIDAWPFHMGISLRRVHFMAQNQTPEVMRAPPLASVYLAADYQHLHDDFAHHALSDGMPLQVKSDAAALHLAASEVSDEQ